MAMTDSKLLSDHFTPWSASPYHLLHPLQPYLHKERQYFETFWGGLSLEPEARTTWATSRKANKTGKNKKLKQNQNKINCWENVWFWLKRLLFFVFPRFFVFVLVLKWKNKKNLGFCFFNGYDQSRSQSTQSRFFVFFNILGLVFCIEKSQIKKIMFFETLIDHVHSKKKKRFPFRTKKNKKPRENQKNTYFASKPNILSKVVVFLIFLVLLWCTGLPAVSLCLLTLSVLGSQTLIKVSHSRACALCETKLGIGCAVMFMHLKISCCSAFLLYL